MDSASGSVAGEAMGNACGSAVGTRELTEGAPESAAGFSRNLLNRLNLAYLLRIERQPIGDSPLASGDGSWGLSYPIAPRKRPSTPQPKQVLKSLPGRIANGKASRSLLQRLSVA